ncbi:MAG TPA: 5'/3'-nucleotidase SurE [Anaerolineae bacterium]|nr:5'/3'-nucleotidase SurE [Anaerolineae bacterium]
MHILVTNDDGVFSPGLLALAQAVRPYGKVTILAPHRNWSASGHVKTLDRPLRLWQETLADGTIAHTADGSPSDCVALAAMGAVGDHIDLVVSGINNTANLGHDVTYSGTVTAAMESAINNIPGIAFSLDAGRKSRSEIDFTAANKIAHQIINTVLQHSIPPNLCLNVNIPDLPADDIKGIRCTRQGLRIYNDNLDQRQDPRGRDYYWIGGDHPTGVPEPGTDIGALDNGYVSITPLQLDLTAYGTLSHLSNWYWDRPQRPHTSNPPQPATTNWAVA